MVSSLFFKIKLTITHLFVTIYVSFAQVSSDSASSRLNFLIKGNNSNTLNPPEKKELFKYGYKIQTRGFVLEGKYHDYSGALHPIDSALAFWISLKDTGNEANLRKYKGYLLSNLNKFTEGEEEINRAINLYKSLNSASGVAVSRHDMSFLLLRQNKTDSAIFFENEALSYWLLKKDTFRIAVNYIQLIYLYSKQNDLKRAEDLQKATEQLIGNKLTGEPLINFQYVSYMLFHKLKKDDKENAYKAAYINELAALKKKHIDTCSIYELKKI